MGALMFIELNRATRHVLLWGTRIQSPEALEKGSLVELLANHVHQKRRCSQCTAESQSTSEAAESDLIVSPMLTKTRTKVFKAPCR